MRSVRHILEFKKASGTSRGILKTKNSWIIELRKDDKVGYGECSTIQGLSPDNEAEIEKALELFASGQTPDLSNLPALNFAFEMAELDLIIPEPGILFENTFSRADLGIEINGLIWMGEKNFMLEQIKQKIEDGYGCIKMKIGAIDFEEELELLSYIRKQFSKDDIILRVDANGAFSAESALEKLKRLSDFELHSIEQPIEVGQWEAMAKLCAESPLDIALDEELIGLYQKEEKALLLDKVKPPFIILKPSLLGGFKASEEWIELCKERKIEYWVTSALESNIGLNAIAQWTASLNLHSHQGLGTGMLFTNNIPSPLYIQVGKLHYGQAAWDYSSLGF